MPRCAGDQAVVKSRDVTFNTLCNMCCDIGMCVCACMYYTLRVFVFVLDCVCKDLRKYCALRSRGQMSRQATGATGLWAEAFAVAFHSSWLSCFGKWSVS